MGYFSQIPSLRAKKNQFTDIDIVLGLQGKNRKVEDQFYASCKRYFTDKFDDVFFDLDRKQEVFQEAFIRLWTQIDDRTIRVADGVIQRQRSDGSYQPMTCSLTTFLMAIAKNEYREIVRDNKEEYYAEFFDDAENAEVEIPAWADEEDAEEQKNRIVSECISQMLSRCLDILTLFYYEGKSLDEILLIRSDKNTSKDGLKTAKNKCMNTLKERILVQFNRFHLTA